MKDSGSSFDQADTREMPVLPSPQPRRLIRNKHTCISSGRRDGYCGHCDARFVCPDCGHRGMRTIDCKKGNFILRCPVCDCQRSIHWMEYNLTCPRCGRTDALGTHTEALEPIIRCLDCGEIPRSDSK